MNSTIPAELLGLKTRFETWRTNRKYVRQPIPDELSNARRPTAGTLKSGHKADTGSLSDDPKKPS